jgi:micrococcal nuclease
MGCVNSVEKLIIEFAKRQQPVIPPPEQPVIPPPEHPLTRCTYSNTTPFAPVFTEAKVIKVYDGDTIHVAALIAGVPQRFMIRMYGYDSPELKSKDPNEKKAANIAKGTLSDRVLNKLVNVKIYPIKEKFGRILAVLSDDQGEINKWMVSEGHGKPYFGGTKEGFASEIATIEEE